MHEATSSIAGKGTGNKYGIYKNKNIDDKKFDSLPGIYLNRLTKSGPKQHKCPDRIHPGICIWLGKF